MGSHASQLNVEERWKVVRYVQTLQNPDAMKNGTEPKEDNMVEGDSDSTMVETALKD